MILRKSQAMKSSSLERGTTHRFACAILKTCVQHTCGRKEAEGQGFERNRKSFEAGKEWPRRGTESTQPGSSEDSNENVRNLSLPHWEASHTIATNKSA